MFANTKALLRPIREAKVPAIGFVVGGGADNLPKSEQRRLLQLWLDAGCELGNHTWTHADLDAMSVTDYEAQIMKTDQYLHELLDPVKVDFFRSPYLNDGKNRETKEELQSFLRSQSYKEAPVTIDMDEFYFAGAYDKAVNKGDLATASRIERTYLPYVDKAIRYFEGQSVRVFGRVCSQVILLHAHYLNAKMMPAILDLFRRRHYRFVSLREAISDPAYRTPDKYYGSGGISWIYRWELGKGMSATWPLSPPDWIVRLNAQK